MKILVLSNFYPPNVIGGMEHRCQEVVEGLRRKGHQLAVLTTRAEGNTTSSDEAGIYRRLSLESDLLRYRPLDFFLSWRKREKTNISCLRTIVGEFAPDLIFIWGMWNLSRALAYWAEQMRPNRVVYSFAHDWPVQPDMHTAYWQQPTHQPILRLPKRLVASFALALVRREQGGMVLQFKHAVCASRALHNKLTQAGTPLKNVRIVYPGIQIEKFLQHQNGSSTQRRARLALLYAGSLSAHKGVHTAIETVHHCVQEGLGDAVSLTVTGAGHPDYEAYLHQLVAAYRLESHVTFKGWVPRVEMPGLLAAHDILLFPTVTDEPFSRVILEAMAAGLVVVGTPTGGTAEILSMGETGLIFEPGDARMAAKHVAQLVRDPELRARLSHNARSVVVQRFNIQQMIDEMEQYLLNVHANQL